MTSPVLVTGGTGALGRHVVARLRDLSREVRVLSRGPSLKQANGIEYVTGDLSSGEGLTPAVAGVDVIVHCASSRSGDADATRKLVEAACAGHRAPHLVYISIVGADRVPFGYLRSKLDSERVVAESGLPWTTLRATQFYSLLLRGAQQLAKLPIIPVPAGFVVQPIDPREVAVRLADLALGPAAGRVPDMGGPQVLDFAEVIRAYLRTRHRHRLVVPVRVPGIRAIRAGALLATSQSAPGRGSGQRTWQHFLTENVTT
jgi:uncharacterized protein YbjT (DUF2867 family)